MFTVALGGHTYLAQVGIQSKGFLLGLRTNWGPSFYIYNICLYLIQTHRGKKRSATQHERRPVMIPTFPQAYNTAELVGNPSYTYDGRQYFQYTRL